MGRRLSPALAGIGLAAALLWFGLGAPKREAVVAPDVAPLVGEVDARIREAIAGVEARADTLGQLPRLRSAVATDEQTVRDLTSDELAFRTRPGEHIEIAQIARQDGRDGTSRTLLRLPDDQLPLPMNSAGVHLQIVDGRLQAVSVVSVTPRDRAGELRGALAVAQAVELSSFGPRFVALGLQASLDVGERSILLAGVRPPTTAPSHTVALASAAAESAKLAIFAASGGGGAPPGSRPLWGPLGLLLVGLIAAVVVRGRNPPNAADLPPRGPDDEPYRPCSRQTPPGPRADPARAHAARREGRAREGTGDGRRHAHSRARRAQRVERISVAAGGGAPRPVGERAAPNRHHPTQPPVRNWSGRLSTGRTRGRT